MVRWLREARGSPRSGPSCSTPRSVCLIQCAAHSRMLTPRRALFSYSLFDELRRVFRKSKDDTIVCASSGTRADDANARAGRTPQDSDQERIRHPSGAQSPTCLRKHEHVVAGIAETYITVLVHVVIVRRAPCFRALWLMRRQVRIDSIVYPSPGGLAAALFLRRDRHVSRAREARYIRILAPHRREGRADTIRARVRSACARPSAGLSSYPTTEDAIPTQAKADVVASIDAAAPEQRRIRPTTHYFPELPPLQHLERAIIVLPGTTLYLAQLGLMVWPCRSSRPSWSARTRST
jgi:hypothetical protein